MEKIDKKAQINESDGTYTVIVPTEIERIPKLGKNKKPETDEEGDPILEVKVIKSIQCVVKPTFQILKRAYSKMTILGAKNKIELNLMGAGEHVLEYGWVSGDEQIRKNIIYKAIASLALAEIVTQFEAGELKKN